LEGNLLLSLLLCLSSKDRTREGRKMGNMKSYKQNELKKALCGEIILKKGDDA